MLRCMYVCMYICMYVLCMHAYMYVCMYACMYVCMDYICVLHVCLYVCLYLCIFVCLYVCMKVYCKFQLQFHPCTQAILCKNWSSLFIVLQIIHQMQIWAMLVFIHIMLGPWHPKFVLDCFHSPVYSWPGHHNLFSTTLKLKSSLANPWNAVGQHQKCPNSMMSLFYQKCY